MDEIIDRISHGEELVTGYEQEIAEKVGAIESEVIEKIERNIYFFFHYIPALLSGKELKYILETQCSWGIWIQ